jgi:hypothetical protein
LVRRRDDGPKIASSGKTLSMGWCVTQKRHDFWFALALLAACVAPEPQKQIADSAQLVRSDSVGPSGTSPQIPIEAVGPRLLVDSAVAEARLEIIANEYVLRISPSMARALEDSLPDFKPIPRSEFHKSVLSWVAEHDSLARPLSVVIGDFDGDGRRDVAMMGVSRDTSATVMVFARSDSVHGNQILYIHRPLRSVRTWPAETFLRLVRRGPLTVEGEDKPFVIPLRADAVEVVGYEKGSVLYYLEGGVLRQIITSD